ncbi:MAG TPA: hydroxyphenylacetyl-CoA thioesterase PaaI [Sedimenticola sp.]|nr:hydroxyphenylacetyl-CoA thioesterase PaaI [Sedimenticola sp.]
MSDEEQLQAERIGHWMAEQDRFARRLGMELEQVAPGRCRVGMTVTGEMLNAVGITHGGVTFSLADFAFAVASNSHGQVAVALTAQINYPAASREGERLTAEAREVTRSRRTGLYNIEVRSGERLIALFTGTVYRRSDPVSRWMETDAGND